MPLGVTSTLYYLSNTVLGCFAQFFLGLSSLATLLSLCFSVTFSCDLKVLEFITIEDKG